MAIQKTLNNQLMIIQEFTDEYQFWCQNVLENSFFSKEQAGASVPPHKFVEWLKGLSLEVIDIDGRYDMRRKQLLETHYGLVTLSNTCENDRTKESFSHFYNNFRSYIIELQNFTQAIVLEEWGFDVFSGLKNNVVMKSGLQIELDRLSREGHPFCVGLARIDNFAKFEKAVGQEKADELVKTVAGLIQKTLRTYDEAYRVSRNHFIMCIKQSDISKGQRALERLRELLEKSNTLAALNDKNDISMSCCVASPTPSDEIEDLIDNLYVDLDTQIKEQGTVLTYQELSPLQRYILSDSEKNT
ncbi:MAG: diguanylate cyclase [Rhodospirillales bacterium]|nr:diguanylate cyclase [Alphaproteobacteria bacterium]MCB9981647.1 diguanylate cyclase [Rhodospirillales bacterium]